MRIDIVKKQDTSFFNKGVFIFEIQKREGGSAS